jgi:hypothetical protein
MKKFTWLFFIILFNIIITNVWGQDVLYVVQTKGSISLKNAPNIVLKTGDKISPNDELLFHQPSATCVVISKEKGRMVIKLNNGAKSAASASELIATVRSVLLPAPTSQQLSARSLQKDETVLDIKQYFGDKSFYLPLDSLETLPLDKNYYPSEGNNSFFFKYAIDNQARTYSLVYEEGILQINWQAFRKSLPPNSIEKEDLELTLFFRNSAKKDIKKTVTFYPALPEKQKLLNEVAFLIKFYQQNDFNNAEIKNKTYEYLTTAYGKTNYLSFCDWLKANFNIE